MRTPRKERREEQRLETLESIQAATSALEMKHEGELHRIQPEPPAARSQYKGQRSPRKVSHAFLTAAAAKLSDATEAESAVPARAAWPTRNKNGISLGGSKPWTTNSSSSGKSRPAAAAASAATMSPSTPRTPPRLRKSPHKGSPRKEHAKYFLDLQPQNGGIFALVVVQTGGRYADGRTMVWELLLGHQVSGQGG